MKAADLIRRIPDFVNKKGTENIHAVIQYNISEPMFQLVQNGEVSIHEGQAETPTLTISMADDDLISLFKGQLNPMLGFMNGKIKLKGDMMLAQKLMGFIDQKKVNDLYQTR